MEGFDISKVSEIYVGSSPVSSIYLGSNKLWPAHDYSKDYLTFEAIEDATFKFTKNSLQYSLDDGSTWTTLAANTATPTVLAGNKILWKQTGLTPSSSGIGIFSATGNFEASGNIMSLYYGDGFVGQNNLTGKNYAFRSLFNGNGMLINVKNLILPATTLSTYCYHQMFYGCSSLTTPPIILPATILSTYCYYQMFANCSSLTTAPELPATTLADHCYFYMFTSCSSLTTAPELAATTLAKSCYYAMFGSCSSLTTAPELPATTLATNCYASMFGGCSSLTTAPELPATILTDHCYYYMFSGCSNLNYIKMLATDISASSCLTGWVQRVSSTGTLIKSAAMTTLSYGDSGIPGGWTVQNV